MPLNKGPHVWEPSQPFLGKATKKKKKKNVFSVEFMACQRFAALASVCCYWEHEKTHATEGEVTSPGSKANRGRNPEEVWETSDMQSARSWLQQRGHGDWQRGGPSLSAS